jgi:outer membrane receptor protein involved in Fe transport
MGVVLLPLTAVLAAAQASPVAEATAEPKADSEIVVTGERVKRSLKDTAASVAVFGKDEMEALAAPDRIQQLLQLVPNVLMPSTRDTPMIRGQSSAGVLTGLPGFLGGARPRTVVQIDGRTVTFNEFANSSEGLWDVDHVEVFRSPQTTTQGVNSIAGAIFIHTADPTYGFEVRARAIGGELRRRQASAVISGPLLGDQLAFRVSGDLYRGRSAEKLSGPIAGVNLNQDHYSTARAKLLAEPHAVPGLRLLVTYAHTHSQAPQAEVARRPFHERRDDFYIFGYFKSDVDSVTAAVTYPIAEALESRTVLTWGRERFRRFAPQGFGQTRIRGHDRSFETVLEWKPRGPISAVGGINLLAMDLDQFIDLTAAELGTGTFRDRQRSAGLFGELGWRPAGRLALTAGARYQSDGKRRSGVLRMSPDLPLDYDKTVHAFLPKASAAYDINRDLRVGVLVQRAYNPGGVTLDPEHRTQLEFRPEYLWDYEAFTRAALLDGAVTVTGNLFYNDIRDAQRELDFALDSPGGQVGLLQIISEPRARIYGAELEVSAKVSRRLTVRTAVGLLRTRITKTVSSKDPMLKKQFGGSPHFTGGASVEWEPVRKLRLSSQVRHNSGYFGDDAETPMLRINPSTTVDARASWESGRFTVFAYAQNLFDEFHITGWGGPHDDPDVIVGLSEPRELGAGVEARF